MGTGRRGCLAAERPVLHPGRRQQLWLVPCGHTLLVGEASEDEEYQRCIVELIWCFVLCDPPFYLPTCLS